MRISYVINTRNKCHPQQYNLGMYRLLCHTIQSMDNVEIVDKSADIVHIFGLWNMAYAKQVAKYRKRCVPVVFTPLGGLSAIMDNDRLTNNVFTRKAIREICHNGTVVHATGRIEKEAIGKIACHANVHVIPNPDITFTTDTSTMSKEMFALYEETIENNDSYIRRKIQSLISKACVKDEAISALCADLLYINERLKMQNIPQGNLENLSRLLTVSDYDESIMRSSLESLRIYKFASYIMTLLNKRYNLTEGFMPMEGLEGKIVDKMEKAIIQ